MAKREKDTTEAPAKVKKSKTGIYAIGAAAVAALAVGLYFFSAEAPADPKAPKTDPEMAALMETGPLELSLIHI